MVWRNGKIKTIIKTKNVPRDTIIIKIGINRNEKIDISCVNGIKISEIIKLYKKLLLGTSNLLNIGLNKWIKLRITKTI